MDIRLKEGIYSIEIHGSKNLYLVKDFNIYLPSFSKGRVVWQKTVLAQDRINKLCNYGIDDMSAHAAYLIEERHLKDKLSKAMTSGLIKAPGKDFASLAHLVRFLAKYQFDLNKLRSRMILASTSGESLKEIVKMEWPVIQGLKNQLSLQKISEQDFESSEIHKAINLLLDN